MSSNKIDIIDIQKMFLDESEIFVAILDKKNLKYFWKY